MLPSRANAMIGGTPAEKETVGRVVGRGWRVKVWNATFWRSQRQFPRFFESFQKFKILDPDPDPDPGSGIRVLKPDPDPDPEKFKNWIRIPDPEKFKNWIRIRIRIQAKSPDPTGSGSGSGSETLCRAMNNITQSKDEYVATGNECRTLNGFS